MGTWNKCQQWQEEGAESNLDMLSYGNKLESACTEEGMLASVSWGGARERRINDILEDTFISLTHIYAQ